MKLTIVLLTIGLLQVHAKGVSQTITLAGRNVPLQKIFVSIEKQTGFSVFGSKELLEKAKPVSVNVVDMKLHEFIQMIAKGQSFNYEIVNRTIFFTEKGNTAHLPVFPILDSLPIMISGTIMGPNTQPLAGATVRVKGKNVNVVADERGSFELTAEIGNILVVSYIGFQEKKFKINSAEQLTVKLDRLQDYLDTTEITVSTGYQKIPKERATGAFTFIDNELFNRTVSADIFSRLKGVTNSLLFDLSTSTGNPLGISVRGRSTIFSNTQPLIVVDNFPFEGDINTINPNDVASVTILKDAAAASIWGARAGNGVIVITTKRGNANKQPLVSFNTNLTVIRKPDLYFESQLSSSEFIDVEKFLFENGAYASTINNGYATISPIVSLLQKHQDGELTESELNAEIDQYRNFDIRDQLTDYYFRRGLRQQYHANVSGGSDKQFYFLSAGYDKDQAANIGESNDRFTLKGNNTYKLFNDRLNVSADLTFSTSKRKNDNAIGYTPVFPYDRIADESGNALSVLQNGGLREAFTDTIGGGQLLDWKYRPLEELRNKYNSLNNVLTDYRLNVGLHYKILSPLSISVNYQFYKAAREIENYSNEESFRVRDIINGTSIQDDITGELTRSLPQGGILFNSYNSLQSNSGRAQLTLNETLNGIHQINGIAGYEVREDRSNGYSNTVYGYNPDLATHVPVDLASKFPYFHRPGSFTPSAGSRSWTIDRFVSYFINGSYAYNNRYVVTGSFRKDESNLFGVKANQKGVPLWSTGFAWNIHNEPFFKNYWFSSLKIRSTYGFNGNVNKSISAYLTSAPFFTNVYNENIAMVVNPPNEALRWERVENINFGIDFQLANKRIEGSIDYYIKNGKDLIGQSPYAPQTGIVTFTGNVANSRTTGVDVLLNTVNINKQFKWSSTAIFNFSKDRITDYFEYVGSNETIISPGVARITPLNGFPINAIFSYKWAGLSDAGRPLGYLNGEISDNYTQIRNLENYKELDFWGSATPTLFGAFRNTLSYKFIEFSFNLTYKLKYFVRRPALTYGSLFLGNYNKPDFDDRWQKPGDEQFTDVPGLIYPANSSADSYYANSSVNIERGDHIRLQDIQVSINLTPKDIRGLPVKNLSLYSYITNIGIIWKSSERLKDPDIRFGYAAPLSVAFGIKAEF